MGRLLWNTSEKYLSKMIRTPTNTCMRKSKQHQDNAYDHQDNAYDHQNNASDHQNRYCEWRRPLPLRYRFPYFWHLKSSTCTGFERCILGEPPSCDFSNGIGWLKPNETVVIPRQITLHFSLLRYQNLRFFLRLFCSFDMDWKMA